MPYIYIIFYALLFPIRPKFFLILSSSWFNLFLGSQKFEKLTKMFCSQRTFKCGQQIDLSYLLNCLQDWTRLLRLQNHSWMWHAYQLKLWQSKFIEAF